MAPVTVRIVVVGTGRFGQLHASCVARLDSAELVGVVDSSGERARAVGQQFGVASSRDLLGLVADTSPDAVIVATPGSTHRSIALELLALRLPLLIEKPVGLTAQEVGQIAAAAGGVLVLAGHVLRFSATHRWARNVARSGALGSLTSIRASRQRDRAHLDAYPDIDIVRMTMVHDIDLGCWITEPIELTVLRAGPSRGHEVVAVGATDGGTAWSLSTGWTLPAGAEPADRLEVLGAKGFVSVDAATGTQASPGVRPPPPADSEDQMLAREIDHFVACVRSGTASDVITLDEAAAVMSIAESVWAQASLAVI